MINVALVGNPNVGKTTVFNAITGLSQKVGNWPGVTIEKREGHFGKNINIVDLPGIYAMDTFSNEEKISKNYLDEENVDVIVNVVDAANLSRNLYLTTQLMKYNKPVVIILNMIDMANSKGIKIDYEKLEKELGVKIVPMIAKKKVNGDILEKAILESSKSLVIYKEYPHEEYKTYKELEKSLSKCIRIENDNKKNLSDKIDDIVLNPILAYPIFIGLLYTLFKFTFDWVGGPLQEFSAGAIETYIQGPVSELIANSSPWFYSLIVDGIIGGLGGALPFFPLIFVLFLGITLLEDSGYMSRIAFLMDKVMAKVGLSGKTFIPMVMGLGCSSPAIMATRTLDSEQDRKITALIAPLMTCGAKLPIYAMFVSIFFPKNAALVTTSLYLIGIIVAIFVALFITRSQNSYSTSPFIIELPKYSMPTFSQLLKNTWNKSKGFLVRVCTIMFAMSIVIWALSSFNFSGFTSEINESFLATLGGLVAPIFAPLGFGDWRAGVSILTGLSAKEIVVATMEILYGDLNTVLPTMFTAVTAYGFLVFSALYTPCIAALATMQKEYGTKMTLISFLYQFFIAWVGAFYVYQIGTLITTGFVIENIMALIIGTIIIFAIGMIIFKKLQKTNLNKEVDVKSELKAAIQ
ncbi:ferrous iron transport protein B [Paraclostridium bifermentans]|uniref:ferrous iron transport protein B n=1 Tax=Paraclostridium bifermentans TaxID=1490 RepID=UPI0021C3D990|nr:ferrous iron transport protein B [Paraclostridium bifermentans]GKZ01824.1 ferrous iron transport protein B [Paraclostridium bifermentans]GKZ07032.1 ferrous iron transport protein B [Paraclostridium bifermentans]GKZ11823.1 ferrous iron transport protein B [Paraclostridium bifermentans]